jgi:hypothetical protein
MGTERAKHSRLRQLEALGHKGHLRTHRLTHPSPRPRYNSSRLRCLRRYVSPACHHGPAT